ncbi:MAG: CPBP family intramembrane metalloprotease [Caulobacteraceae bacterium]|nr:CPBP family intramembrane metalloprotease [Caulobacteraceae bacterium]
MFATDPENPWITAVRNAPRRAPAALVGAIGLVVPGALLFASRASASVVPDVFSDSLLFGVLALAAFIGTRLEGRRLSPRETYGAAGVIAGLALGLGAVFACAAVATIAGANGMILGPPRLPVGPLLAAILVAALGAVAQEVFFRGWIQPLLCASWGVWSGLVATAAAFLAFHVAAGVHGLVGGLNVLLAGLLLGLLALRSGGLAASVATHLIWVWTAFGGLGFSPQGLIGQVQLSGPALWSGGDQGLGGSLATTAVLLVLVASILTVKPRAVPGAGEPRTQL